MNQKDYLMFSKENWKFSDFRFSDFMGTILFMVFELFDNSVNCT